MIPDFGSDGLLSPGIHWATWQEISDRFGANDQRKILLAGLKEALNSLKTAGCHTVYIDGSFVTSKEVPVDFDACWDSSNVDPRQLDPVLLRFEPGRVTQKVKYGGELFISKSKFLCPKVNPSGAFLQKGGMYGRVLDSRPRSHR